MDSHPAATTTAFVAALEHAGGRDPRAVVGFLDEHGPGMRRPTLRAATAKLDQGERARLLGR